MRLTGEVLDKVLPFKPPPQALRFSHGRGERETRMTDDEPQGTMGRVRKEGEARLARCPLPTFLCAHIFIERETSGYEAATFLYSLKLTLYKTDISLRWTLSVRGVYFWEFSVGVCRPGPGCSKAGYSAIHRIYRYPAVKYYDNQLRYPVDSDLSSG